MVEKLIKTITSARATFFCLLLLIFIFAMKPPSQNAQSSVKHYTYLALGDSYTIGEKVNANENFPTRVTIILKAKGFNFRKPEIVAQTGWTTDELHEAIIKAKLRGKYDFVTLLIGVNNQYRGKKVANYIPGFESLLNQAIQFASGDTTHIIVLSIPDWGVTPFAEGGDRKKISAEIDEYNAANKLIAEKYKVHYINITESTREAQKDPSLLTTDGLHPSTKEYERWAKQVAEYMQSKL